MPIEILFLSNFVPKRGTIRGSPSAINYAISGYSTIQMMLMSDATRQSH